MKKRFEVLEELIKKYGYKSMIEIGVGRGEVLEHILKTVDPPFTYNGVDPYQEYVEYSNDVNSKKDRITKNHSALMRIMDETKTGMTVVMMRTFSHKAVKVFESNSIDLVFVDGNHSFNYVLQDILLYWRVVSENGIMSLHDYHDKKFSGVKKAVDMWAEQSGRRLHMSGDIVYFKKEG